MTVSRKRVVLAIAVGVPLLALIVGALVLNSGGRRDVDALTLADPASELRAASFVWSDGREILPYDGDFISGRSVGRAWEGVPGDLVQDIYKYRSPLHARLQFFLMDPVRFECDPAECDETRELPPPAELAADETRLACDFSMGQCYKYYYLARYGQYVIQLRFDAAIGSDPVPMDAFLSVATATDSHLDAVLKK
jgi:hypothetical protein